MYAILADWIEVNKSIKISFAKYVNESWDIVDSFELEYLNRSLIMELDKDDIPFFAYVNKDKQIELLKYDPEAVETPDDSDDDIVSDEDETADEDKKDSDSSGCGMVI